MTLDRAEALRYMGYRGQPDGETEALIDRWGGMLCETASPRFVDRRVAILREAEETLVIGGMRVKSQSLARHLAGCREAVLLAATLGAGVDRLMHRAEAVSMAAAVVLQGCAAALIERYCDEVCLRYRAEGLYPTSRFSPGYGDFSLEHQRELLRLLDAPRRIGLSCTDSLMLTPVKSVTAVIGLGSQPAGCAGDHCEMCGQRDCPYRRR